MIAASVEPIWPRRRWLAGFALVLALQLAFIFLLSERKTASPPPIAEEPAVSLLADHSELPGLASPTVFILPNRRGFSGEAWMQVPSIPYELPKWVDPAPPAVTNAAPQLGVNLAAYVQTNLASIFELAAKPEPEPDVLISFENPVAQQSAVSIEGELASRPLLTPFKLEPWPSAGILTNSEVLASVDRNGKVFSAVLLPDGKSGSKEADADALRQVKAAHFQPLGPLRPGQPPPAESRLQWGRFVFPWTTVAPPPAANPAANPPANPPPIIEITGPHE